MTNILQILDDIIAARKISKTPAESYVSSLYSKGHDAILKKIAEESAEVLMAAKDHQYANTQDSRKHLIYETADLWFHSLILLHQHNISSIDILNELYKRQGVSGIIEKASRQNSDNIDNNNDDHKH
jgi:phosphoribosyl-ATP pyrophosphohydrolase